jgi:hypothetical protein
MSQYFKLQFLFYTRTYMDIIQLKTRFTQITRKLSCCPRADGSTQATEVNARGFFSRFPAAERIELSFVGFCLILAWQPPAPRPTPHTPHLYFRFSNLCLLLDSLFWYEVQVFGNDNAGSKIWFRRKLSGDWIRVMFATIPSRNFCLPVCCLKT